MIGLPWWKNYDDMLSCFHPIPERHGQTDGRTDGRAELLYQYRASMCWRAIKRVQFFAPRCNYIHNYILRTHTRLKMTMLTYCTAEQESKRSAILSQHDCSRCVFVGDFPTSESPIHVHITKPAMPIRQTISGQVRIEFHALKPWSQVRRTTYDGGSYAFCGLA